MQAMRDSLEREQNWLVMTKSNVLPLGQILKVLLLNKRSYTSVKCVVPSFVTHNLHFY